MRHRKLESMDTSADNAPLADPMSTRRVCVRRQTLIGLLSGLLLALLSACTSPKLLDAQNAYRAGNLDAAAKAIEAYAQSETEENGQSRLIALIEHGSIARARGSHELSNDAFEQANAMITAFERSPSIRVSRETLSLLGNPNALPYRGTAYDKIMVSTYRALNFLQLGDLDSARTELFAAFNRQVDSVEKNAERIEDSIQEIEDQASEPGSGASAASMDRTRNDPAFQRQLEPLRQELQKFRAYAPYVNPYAEFVQALGFMAAAAEFGDLERSRVSLERLAGMLPENDFIRADLKTATAATRGEPLPPLTYILFESGTAAYRRDYRIDIPVFLQSGRILYVGANIPRLITNHVYVGGLRIRLEDGNEVAPQLLCDMDTVVAREFEDELPLIVTKTLIGSGLKATAAYFMQQAAGDGWAGLLTTVATTAYQVAMNNADLRTWATLPKHVYYARFPTPDNRRLELSAPGVAPIPVTIAPGRINVIFVKSLTPAKPPEISQFNLDRTTWQTAQH